MQFNQNPTAPQSLLRKPKKQRDPPQGFALIAVLTLSMLAILLLLGMLTLARTESRSAKRDRYQAEAQANARLALSLALAELQLYAGQDQRVTAKAAILDTNPNTETIDGIANPQLLGVWKNHTDQGDFLVGSDNSAAPNSTPTYGSTDSYSDLRDSSTRFNQGKWRDALRLTWLASLRGDKTQAHLRPIDPQHALTLVGKGTLGEKYARKHPQLFAKEILQVEKLDVPHGALAWAVIDNSQKATILPPNSTTPTANQLAASPHDKLAGTTKLTSGDFQIYQNFDRDLEQRNPQLPSYQSITLASKNQNLQAHYNHFTNDSSGLFTDPILGGFKKDLTPLLFGDPSRTSIDFPSPNPQTSPHGFSSAFPIIANSRHLSHGPSFDALRYWGKLKYQASTSTLAIHSLLQPPSSSLRMRPTTHWRENANDGYTFRAQAWHSAFPKIHPILTDARYHFYFSISGNSAPQKIRTHLQPRVCLWNPYNVALEVPELVVLMPNFFCAGGNFHFQLTSTEQARITANHPEQTSLLGWDGKIRIPCGAQQPLNTSSPPGLFPNTRYLSFVTEPTTFPPGACLVFSPKAQQQITADGISIQQLDLTTTANNILSAEQTQGEDHYYHESQRPAFYQYDDDSSGKTKKRTKTFSNELLDEIDFSQIEHYEPWVVAADNFDFVLKAANGSTLLSAKEICQSALHPTLQLLNGGSGGAYTYNFYFYNTTFGNSSTASAGSFGKLENFSDNPFKEAPATHQIGAKLLWLDESQTEANNPPLRNKYWANADHQAFNPAVIKNWNVRPQLVTRSPASPCTADWHSRSAGAWISQLAPASPHDPLDMPTTNSQGQFAKFPFGAASHFPSIQAAALFDLPQPTFGALSLASLRHAQLSPYSWHSTYIIGASHRDLQAPYSATAHPVATTLHTDPKVDNQWDLLLGGTHPSAFSYGPRGTAAQSSGLLQIGSSAEPVSLLGQQHSTTDEILAYDIAFETNHNLWDHFFLSGLALNASGNNIEPNTLHNARYAFNSDTRPTLGELIEKLRADDGLNFAFWHAAYCLKNQAAFNINSTSVPAWAAFLSGIRAVPRESQNGSTLQQDAGSIFSRTSTPFAASTTAATHPQQSNGWDGGRILSDEDIAKLAHAIVVEVKKRGPFLSLSDMVNRRLASPINDEPTPASTCGTLEAAIEAAQLNPAFEATPWKKSTSTAENHNKPEFQKTDASLTSKTWGAPSYLTQADILEPLAPAMTVRGDTFTIRCYGEAKEGNQIKATTYLEATVTRTPEYLDSTDPATTPTLHQHYATGERTPSKLSATNQRFGRKWRIKSLRWLSKDEI